MTVLEGKLAILVHIILECLECLKSTPITGLIRPPLEFCCPLQPTREAAKRAIGQVPFWVCCRRVVIGDHLRSTNCYGCESTLWSWHWPRQHSDTGVRLYAFMCGLVRTNVCMQEVVRPAHLMVVPLWTMLVLIFSWHCTSLPHHWIVVLTAACLPSIICVF